MDHAMHSRGRLGISTRVVVLTVLLLLIGGCGDDREYPGSNGRSLDELMDRFGISLPGCQVTDVRFADAGGPLSSGLFLTYRLPVDCLSDSLASLGLSEAKKRTKRGDVLPFSEKAVREFGWPDDAAKSYDYYTRSTQRETVHLVVDTSESDSIAYIHCLGP